jgi:hypothetical protein
LYHPTAQEYTHIDDKDFTGPRKHLAKTTVTRRKNFVDQGVVVSALCLQQVEVEQEREVEIVHEIHQIREREKSTWEIERKYQGLHKDLKQFAKNGDFKPHSDSQDFAFAFLVRALR